MKTTTPQKRAGFGSIFNAGENENLPSRSIPEPGKEIEAKPIQTEIKVTFLMDSELHQKIKIMAHWELTTLREIINDSLQSTITEYEKTHGQLVKVPKSKKTL